MCVRYLAALIGGLLLTQPAEAQVETIQVGIGGPLGSATDLAAGQFNANRFTTGDHGFRLGEIRTIAYLWPANRQPPTRQIQARIYSSSIDGAPDVDITGTMLSQSMTLFLSQDAIFRPQFDVYLQPNTSYWLAVGSAPDGDVNATNIDWMAAPITSGITQIGVNGTIDAMFSRSTNGGVTWTTPVTIDRLHMIQISNTFAPEPLPILLMLGGIGLFPRRRHNVTHRRK